MTEFCQTPGIGHDICRKVIVAIKQEELPLLENLYQRGCNGLAIQKIGMDEFSEVEPHVNGLEAIRVPHVGIVNYRQVNERSAEIIKNHGGEIHLNMRKRTIHVCNAPSSAATAFIAIGKEVVNRIPEQVNLKEATII